LNTSMNTDDVDEDVSRAAAGDRDGTDDADEDESIISG
jgi:hypothetical protein